MEPKRVGTTVVELKMVLRKAIKRSDRSDDDNNSYTSKTTAVFGAEVSRKEEMAIWPFEDQNKILSVLHKFVTCVRSSHLTLVT